MWRRTQTVLLLSGAWTSSVTGLLAARMAESSRCVRQRQETLGRQVLNDGLKGRPESALRQTGDDDVQTCWRSIVVSRQDMAARCHVDTGVSEHRDGTWFFLGPSTNEGHGEVESLTVLPRTRDERQCWALTGVDQWVTERPRPVLCCNSQLCWRRVHEAASAERPLSENDAYLPKCRETCSYGCSDVSSRGEVGVEIEP